MEVSWRTQGTRFDLRCGMQGHSSVTFLSWVMAVKTFFRCFSFVWRRKTLRDTSKERKFFKDSNNIFHQIIRCSLWDRQLYENLQFWSVVFFYVQLVIWHTSVDPTWILTWFLKSSRSALSNEPKKKGKGTRESIFFAVLKQFFGKRGFSVR